MNDANGEHEYRAEVFISLKPLVNDPEGLEIRNGLHSLGYSDVSDVRSGKYLQLRVEASDEAAAKTKVEEMCERLLANTVIEQYRVAVAEPVEVSGTRED